MNNTKFSRNLSIALKPGQFGSAGKKMFSETDDSDLLFKSVWQLSSSWAQGQWRWQHPGFPQKVYFQHTPDKITVRSPVCFLVGSLMMMLALFYVNKQEGGWLTEQLGVYVLGQSKVLTWINPVHASIRPLLSWCPEGVDARGTCPHLSTRKQRHRNTSQSARMLSAQPLSNSPNPILCSLS